MEAKCAFFIFLAFVALTCCASTSLRTSRDLNDVAAAVDIVHALDQLLDNINVDSSHRRGRPRRCRPRRRRRMVQLQLGPVTHPVSSPSQARHSRRSRRQHEVTKMKR